MIQVIAVVGPTASGKTQLAIDVAQALDTEIISADSMQRYRGMEIGTGAPTPNQLARVKHHFVGDLDPSQETSASDFAEAARPVVATLNEAGKAAVVAGGSGLYVQALVDGLFTGPGKNPELRERLAEEAEEEGMGALFDRLSRLDPDYANTINKNDLRRIVRGLEVHELTKRPFSELHREHQQDRDSLAALMFAVEYPREELYARIDRRVDDMMDRGFVDEVRRLRDEGHDEDIMRLKSLGYREIQSYLMGAASLEEATAQMKMNTRRYAKRQLTWFKGDRRIAWIDASVFETNALRVKQIMNQLDSTRNN